MGSKLGTLKVAAKRVGISLDEYLAKLNKDLKWCYQCQTWKSRVRFGLDKSRSDGLCASCIDCRRVKVRKRRKDLAPSAKIQSQAASAVNYEIKKGLMVEPSTLPCRDCGGPAREYHHHLGYARSHWLDVVPLCKKCHVQYHWE